MSSSPPYGSSTWTRCARRSQSTSRSIGQRTTRQRPPAERRGRLARCEGPDCTHLKRRCSRGWSHPRAPALIMRCGEVGDVMKAVVYGGPGQRSWKDVPDPMITDPRDAIIRVDTVTICGTDLHILGGDVPAVRP